MIRQCNFNSSSGLYHHGVKGMRWGVRRFRRKDGTLTPTGKKRYSDASGVKRKSKHRQQLEEQYKKMGLTDEQAQTAANKRIRDE